MAKEPPLRLARSGKLLRIVLPRRIGVDAKGFRCAHPPKSAASNVIRDKMPVIWVEIWEAGSRPFSKSGRFTAELSRTSASYSGHVRSRSLATRVGRSAVGPIIAIRAGRNAWRVAFQNWIGFSSSNMKSPALRRSRFHSSCALSSLPSGSTE